MSIPQQISWRGDELVLSPHPVLNSIRENNRTEFSNLSDVVQSLGTIGSRCDVGLRVTENGDDVDLTFANAVTAEPVVQIRVTNGWVSADAGELGYRVPLDTGQGDVRALTDDGGIFELFSQRPMALPVVIPREGLRITLEVGPESRVASATVRELSIGRATELSAGV